MQGGGFSRGTGGVAGLSPARLLVVGALLLVVLGGRDVVWVPRAGGFLVYPWGKGEEMRAGGGSEYRV